MSKRALLLALLALATLLFAALCWWQLERRTWKLALIDAVAARVHAAPVPAPGPPQWPRLTEGIDAYRHVVVEGVLRNDRETLVRASTDAGPGYWVVTPLRTTGGFTVLVNRGFVPPEQRSPGTRSQPPPAGRVRIVGLLRMSEPGGRLLSANRPGEDRWYSRDVGAIAARRDVGPVAPYFVDADATGAPGGWPRGGLTVVSFANNHLAYAATWLALALMSAFAFLTVWRTGRPPPSAPACER